MRGKTPEKPGAQQAVPARSRTQLARLGTQAGLSLSGLPADVLAEPMVKDRWDGRDRCPCGWTFGIAEIDAAVIGTRAGLDPAAIHELVPADPREAGAASGFALALALRRLRTMTAVGRPALWVTTRHGLAERGALSGRGLVDFGADPDSFLLAAGRSDKEALWAVEEALRSAAVALVVAEVDTADLTATRRLALAARAHDVPAILLRPASRLGPSAARTRWRIAAAPSAPDRLAPFAPGRRARWRVAIEKGWRERPRHWILEWDDEAHRFHLASPLADHPAAAEPPQRNPRAA